MGQKQPNELGLYDMLGNVWEWCLDWHDDAYYGRSPDADPVNTQAASGRVERGGGFYNDARNLRWPNRIANRPPTMDSGLGFRACLAPTIASPAK